jgi:hypothetical protein
MATMTVELVSPERVLFSGEATQVITRTLGGGEIAFLPGHAPFLGALIENHTRITLVDGTVLDVAHGARRFRGRGRARAATAEEVQHHDAEAVSALSVHMLAWPPPVALRVRRRVRTDTLIAEIG